MEPLGDSTGDTPGDVQGHAGDQAAGRFWASTTSESGGEDDSETLSLISPSKYQVSPQSVAISRSASRATKRMEKRRKQQQAVMAWAAAISPMVSPNPVFVQGLAGSSPNSHRLPVLEPPVFVLENFDAEEWITVQRKSRRDAMKRMPGPSRPRRRKSPATSSDHGSNSGYDNGQYRSEGNRWQQNDDWNSENNFDQPAFGGNFGDFDQGYFEAGQGYGQNYNGYGGAQRNRRQFRNYAQGNRGRGGRISRGRFNGRGYGGRFPQTEYQGQEVVNSGTNDPTATLPTVQSQTIAVGVTPIHVPSGTTTPQNEKLAAVVAAAVQSVGADLSKTSKKKEKSDGILCFRCDDTGHMAIDCTAELCLLCDSAKHKSDECHLHAMPKPTAVMYGLCRDELLFFDIPTSPGVRSKRNSGKVGRIRVTGGSLTVHQIAKELSFLIPGNHQWDITKTDDNVFKVVYPTKADFARVRKINDIKVDDTESSPKCKSARCAPIKLWGDRVENGEDGLPSPLPRFEMHEALDGVVHQDYQEEPEVDHQQHNDINLLRKVYEKVEICPLVSVAADYEVLDVPSDRV
ncbi:hypothetical protein ACQ4PT_063373 [Festuca glaucescens]